MQKRFVTIWFRYLRTDWFTIRRPELCAVPFVLASPDHGRMIITAANSLAEEQGINLGMVLADARAIVSPLYFFDDDPELSIKLLRSIAEWFIRYTPSVALDAPNGLILDASGCAHLWGGEESYLKSIIVRLKALGYTVNASMADTIGSAWAVSRFGKNGSIIQSNQQINALLPLSPLALRLEPAIVERMQKLGLRQVKNLIDIPRSALRRRFGNDMVLKLDQVLGDTEEIIDPVLPLEPYIERLPCLEPIVTAIAIEIALKKLLEILCKRLQQEQIGVRSACFTCYRVDGKIEKIQIETNRASQNTVHLFKLFELKISTIEPALGIELFTLAAVKVEAVFPHQEKLWGKIYSLENMKLYELMDRLANKIGTHCIHRYLPAEHYWPERSIRLAGSLHEKANTTWRSDKVRPVQILSKPVPIEVTAPIPDYPPMLFRYKNKLHKIKKADGPERIEREWWLEDGAHRDYYCVEDEEGHRYWLFRAGHYSVDKNHQWFIHGFFA